MTEKKKLTDEELIQGLDNLGKQINADLPLPRKRITVPYESAAGRFHWRRHVLVAAAAVLVLFVSWQAIYDGNSTREYETAIMDFGEADPLMAEVNSLSENALPRVYLFIQGESGVDDASEWNGIN